MSTAKRMSAGRKSGMPRYLRRSLLVARPAVRLAAPTAPVLIRTVAFVPAYLRKRPH
jgi:hypothetical protein